MQHYDPGHELWPEARTSRNPAPAKGESLRLDHDACRPAAETCSDVRCRRRMPQSRRKPCAGCSSRPAIWRRPRARRTGPCTTRPSRMRSACGAASMRRYGFTRRELAAVFTLSAARIRHPSQLILKSSCHTALVLVCHHLFAKICWVADCLHLTQHAPCCCVQGMNVSVLRASAIGQPMSAGAGCAA